VELLEPMERLDPVAVVQLPADLNGLSLRRFGTSRNVEVPADITHTPDPQLPLDGTLRSRFK
jgi:hypothetical protein